MFVQFLADVLGAGGVEVDKDVSVGRYYEISHSGSPGRLGAGVVTGRIKMA